jgi:hypothetical protein
MAPEDSRTPAPPEAPEIDRRIAIPAFRAAGLAVIVLVPVLALFGVFGERYASTAAEAGAIAVQVEFPSRFRYEMLNSITAAVTNRSGRVIDTVTVRLDSAYALRFSRADFTPSATEAYGVPLTSIAPGESRLVVVTLDAERYGRHRGGLHVESTTGDTIVIPIHTSIFP